MLNFFLCYFRLACHFFWWENAHNLNLYPRPTQPVLTSKIIMCASLHRYTTYITHKLRSPRSFIQLSPGFLSEIICPLFLKIILSMPIIVVSLLIFIRVIIIIIVSGESCAWKQLQTCFQYFHFPSWEFLPFPKAKPRICPPPRFPVPENQ